MMTLMGSSISALPTSKRTQCNEVVYYMFHVLPSSRTHVSIYIWNDGSSIYLSSTSYIPTILYSFFLYVNSCFKSSTMPKQQTTSLFSIDLCCTLCFLLAHSVDLFILDIITYIIDKPTKKHSLFFRHSRYQYTYSQIHSHTHTSKYKIK